MIDIQSLDAPDGNEARFDEEPVPCGESGCLCYGLGPEHADCACGCDCPRCPECGQSLEGCDCDD